MIPDKTRQFLMVDVGIIALAIVAIAVTFLIPSIAARWALLAYIFALVLINMTLTRRYIKARREYEAAYRLMTDGNAKAPVV